MECAFCLPTKWSRWEKLPSSSRTAAKRALRCIFWKVQKRKSKNSSVPVWKRSSTFTRRFSDTAFRPPIIEDFVAIQLPTSWRYRLMRWGWPPQNRLARWGVTLLQYALALFALQIVILILHLPGSGIVQVVVVSTAILAIVLFGVAGFGWVRQKLLWRLRNRLIVTYVFVGVIPVILL